MIQVVSRRSWILWSGITVVAVFVAGLVPLLFNRSYYYAADTSQGSYGNWFVLGSQIREGVWPLLNPSAWASGNYIAEGQMGLFSPLTIIIALGATIAGNVVVYATIVKIALLVAGALGVMALLSSWSLTPSLASAGGVLSSLGGFTQYMDAPSWTTNLMIWAIFPWVWWGLRRIVSGHNPCIALVSGYLLVTVGYVHGTILLMVAVVAVLAEALAQARRREAVRVLIAGVLLGLVAIAVYLPGVLTAGVTDRELSGVTNTGFMVVDLTGLASSPIPSSLPQITGWWGTFAPGPLLYTSWILPLVLMTDFGALRRDAKNLISLAFIGVFSLLFVLGPSDLGPLRYPARLMPFVTTCAVMFTVLVLGRYRVRDLSRTRQALVVAVVLVAGYLAFAQRPEHAKVHLAALVGTLGLTVVAMRVARQREGGRDLTILFIVGSLGVTMFQHIVFDGRETSSASDYPSELSDYQGVLPDGVNDGIVIGDPSAMPSDQLFDSTLVANTWYLNGNVSMQNVYTTIFFSAYSSRLCMNHVGATCPELITVLFEEDGANPPLVDLLAIDTIQIIESSGALELLPQPPAGWSTASDDEVTTLWVRDEPIGPAGSAIWSPSGDDFVIDSNGLNFTSFTLENDGVGEVVLSRLAWPGYRTSAGTIAEPFDGFLLTVNVEGLPAGTTVDIRYRPPMWEVGMGALSISLLAGALWSMLFMWRPPISRPSDMLHEAAASN